ncbi:MAG: Uma2 family endonuclease [Salinibacter sp.]
MPETATPPRSIRSAPASTPHQFTREEYFAMADAGILAPDDSVELIDGQIVEMSPENSPHRAAIMKASRAFVLALEGKGYALQTQSTLPLDERNVPEPDLAVLRGTPDDVLEEEPAVVLVVEVADTSLEQDRTVKQTLYAQNDVPEYWVVNLRDRTVEVYWEPGPSEYRQRRTRSKEEPATPRFEDAPSFEVESLLPARS